MGNIIVTSQSMKMTNNGVTLNDYGFTAFPQTIEADNIAFLTFAKMATGNEKKIDSTNHNIMTINGFALECTDVIEVRVADTEAGLATATPFTVKGHMMIGNGLGKPWLSVTNIGISGSEARIAFHGMMVM